MSMDNGGRYGQNGTHSAKHAPMEKKEFTPNEPGTFVGWISQAWGVAWVVSPHRADQRTGWVNGPGK